MKRRSPIALWLLCVLSAGFYVFFWLHRVTGELGIDPENGRPYRWGARVFAVLVPLHCVLFATLFSGQQFIPYLPLFVVASLNAFLLTGLLLWATIQLAARVQDRQRHRGTSRRCSPGVALLLYFVWMLHVPYVQFHINSTIANPERMAAHRSPTHT